MMESHVRIDSHIFTSVMTLIQLHWIAVWRRNPQQVIRVTGRHSTWRELKIIIVQYQTVVDKSPRKLKIFLSFPKEKKITETIYAIIEYLAEYLKYQKNDMMPRFTDQTIKSSYQGTGVKIKEALATTLL